MAKQQTTESPNSTAPATPPTMLLANAKLYMGIESSTIPIENVTPAEVLTLVILHMPGAKRFPITDIVETGETTKRTVSQEFNRLKAKYGAKKLKAIFGVRPQFPVSFDEAMQLGRDNASEVDFGDNPVWGESGLPTPDLLTHSLGG